MSRAEYYGEEAKLPEKFADEVLDLEIKVENEECDLKTIQKLNELYRVFPPLYPDRNRVLHRRRR